MTGSAYVPIVVPIMAFVCMFFWLGLVFWADKHPGYRHHPPQPQEPQPQPDGSHEALPSPDVAREDTPSQPAGDRSDRDALAGHLS